MQTKLKQLVSVGLVSLIAGDALANPLGMTVVQGAAQATQQGSQLNITAAHNAFLQWNSFNIAAGETTRFIQPSASSVVWNRITDVNPSTIYGNLQANGMVVLANQNGFFFGPDAFVQAAGLVVTTTPIAPGMSLSGGANFGAPPHVPERYAGREQPRRVVVAVRFLDARIFGRSRAVSFAFPHSDRTQR